MHAHILNTTCFMNTQANMYKNVTGNQLRSVCRYVIYCEVETQYFKNFREIWISRVPMNTRHL
jgi:hypothetical protein